MIEFETIFMVIGGFAALLYGVNLLCSNLQAILGSKIEKVLKKTNAGFFKGLSIGTIITGIIQNSGTTITMLVGFISAGILSLRSAVPVMLGASIGSTITTQIAAFQVGIYAMPLFAAGFLIHSFSFKRIYKSFGEIAIGLSFLFLGIDFISKGVISLSDSLLFGSFVFVLNSCRLISVIIMAAFTVFIQSSSAASVFVVILGTSHLIDIKTAIFLILGVNLGSSAKIVLMALLGKSFSGKIAFIHLLFNLIGVFIFIIFFDYFYLFIELTSENIGRQIANIHTFYNFIAALAFAPLIPFVVKTLDKYIASEKIQKPKLFYLDNRLLYTPSVALGQVNRAVVDMAKISYKMLENSRLIFFENKTDLFNKIAEMEKEIDEMTGKITEYMMKVSQQNLSKKDSLKLYSLMYILADIEHISDNILNISVKFVDIKKKCIKFSEKANRELVAIYGKLKIMQNLVIKSLREDNLRLAYEIIEHENKVDEIVKKAHDNHLERLKNNACSVKSSKYFSALLNKLERIGDHYDNIAYSVVDRLK